MDDPQADNKDESKFAGMKQKQENPNFIQNLGLMFDALEELADLSLALQNASVTLLVANRLIARQVGVFTARKPSDSNHYNEACQL